MEKNRKTAFDALLEIDTKGAYSNIAVNRAIEKNGPEDPAFVRNLVYGVLENQFFLDHRLAQLMKQPLKKVNPKARILLRLGAYQLEFSHSVPDYAAISESVAIAKKVCRGLEGFVNGVLRSYSRKDGGFQMPDPSADPCGYLSVKYSYHPDIAQMWMAMFGFEGTERLMQAGNMAPPLTIRVNSLKTSLRELQSLLEGLGFQTEPAVTGDAGQDRVLCDTALNVKGTGLMDTEPYRKGLFSVQDISSMLAVNALDPQPGETMLDLCAAPGGKSFYAAERMENRGRIISCDIHPHKITLMQESAKRLGISCVEAVENDGLKLNREWIGMADRVLVDAPCSGLGVVRRKPEIKLHTGEEAVKALGDIQQQILDNAAQYVRPGGRLLYSTCTISKYENEHVTEMFLKKYKDYKLLLSKQFLPDIDNADGFYFTAFQRF